MSDFVNESDCKTRHNETLNAIHCLEKRLYRDNGTLSIQTRLDRLEQTIGNLCKIVYGAVGLALATLGIAILAMVVTKQG